MKAAVLLCIAVGGCATVQNEPPYYSLDQLLSFDDPANCVPSERFKSFLADMPEIDSSYRIGNELLDVDGNPILVFDSKAFIEHHERYDNVRTHPTRAEWQGFPVMQIERTIPTGEGPSSFLFYLAAPVGEVAERLSSLGFRAKIGEYVRFEDDNSVHSFKIGLFADKFGQTWFTCSWQ